MPLEAKNISFRYGNGPWIIRDFNFKIEQGEIVGLTGSSGCGKSTLARILAGYEIPQEGTVNLDGKPLPSNGYNPVQMIFQHPEKAVNPRWRMSKTISEGWNPGKEILSSFGINEEWLSRWPNELSAGELQRFCVVRALSPQTRFLIADEMTTMLDAVIQAQIWNIVINIARQRNLGIIVISHEKPLVEVLCQRVIEMDINNYTEIGKQVNIYE